MSYRQTFERKYVYKKTYNYPASKSGGSITFTDDIKMEVNVNVDTLPFDASVENTNHAAKILKADVKSTQVAEVNAIQAGSELISNSVIDGFFNFIRYEITQQISELRPRVDTKLLQLIDMQKALLAIKKRMEGDFYRIADRYTKTFNELDKELRNRIRALCQSAFTINEVSDRIFSSASRNTLSSAPLVFGAENSSLLTQMICSGLKKRSQELLARAKELLESEKYVQILIQTVLCEEALENVRFKYIPVAYAEKNTEGDILQSDVICSEALSGLKSAGFHNYVQNAFRSSAFKWVPLDGKDSVLLGNYVKQLIEKSMPEANPHTTRVRETIWRLWNANNVESSKILSSIL